MLLQWLFETASAVRGYTFSWNGDTYWLSSTTTLITICALVGVKGDPKNVILFRLVSLETKLKRVRTTPKKGSETHASGQNCVAH